MWQWKQAYKWKLWAGLGAEKMSHIMQQQQQCRYHPSREAAALKASRVCSEMSHQIDCFSKGELKSRCAAQHNLSACCQPIHFHLRWPLLTPHCRGWKMPGGLSLTSTTEHSEISSKAWQPSVTVLVQPVTKDRLKLLQLKLEIHLSFRAAVSLCFPILWIMPEGFYLPFIRNKTMDDGAFMSCLQ